MIREKTVYMYTRHKTATFVDPNGDHPPVRLEFQGKFNKRSVEDRLTESGFFLKSWERFTSCLKCKMDNPCRCGKFVGTFGY